jgi:hypothetical protein
MYCLHQLKVKSMSLFQNYFHFQREVKRRTKELEDSYDEMKRYLQEVLKEVKKK